MLRRVAGRFATTLKVVAVSAGIILATFACAQRSSLYVPIGGASASNPLMRGYYEVVELPPQFRWATADPGPPDSWVVTDLAAVTGSGGYAAIPQGQKSGGTLSLVPEAILIASDVRPARSPKEMADKMALGPRRCSPTARSEIHSSPDEYLFTETFPACGSNPAQQWIVRLASGERTAFTMMFVRKAPPLDDRQTDTIVQLISSFKVAPCPNPSVGCFQPIRLLSSETPPATPH